MQIKKSYDINELRDYSSLFSRSEVNCWLKLDFTSINLKIARYQTGAKKHQNYLDYLKHIYKILERYYPNEYIYKNEFLNKWLLKEIGTTKSKVFNEFRIGKAVADLVMFNGNSKVFEIKSLLDKESRLSNQLIEYKKIFNEVYIIVPDVKLKKYLSFDNTIGIITYNNELKQFLLIRSAKKNNEIDVNSLMNVFHTKEYIKLVQDYYGLIPSYTDFNKFEVCKNLILKIPVEYVNEFFIQTMKKRKINNAFSFKSTNEFNQVCLSLNLNDKQKEKLFINLKSAITA
ncbi:MAG: sce7726 family protein [Flavobacterium sp. JAD_PAG50586_2]|nr:MAG: sce7726 family protein [Flavobacterium sp. JAD_PAG50586_2]